MPKAKRLCNADLIGRIERHVATASELRDYARRVERMNPKSCRYGHFDCALVEGGPCLDESLARANGTGADAR